MLRLVTFGQEPQPVDDQLIEAIRRRIETNAVEPALKPGKSVEIIEGPFNGLDAIFKTQKDEQRPLLLTELLHRQLSVNVPLAALRST